MSTQDNAGGASGEADDALVVLDAAQLAEDRALVVFTYTDPFGRERAGIVLRHGQELRAWEDMCPHWATVLEGEDGEVWDESRCYLQCAQHGALFDPLDGACIFGPPEGTSLRPLVIQERAEGDQIVVRRSGLSFGFGVGF